MKKILVALILFVCVIGCKNHLNSDKLDENLTTFLTYDPVVQENFHFFSELEKDSFNIFISLPKDYKKSDKSFPVVYVLDANVAFDMVATIMKLQSNGLDCKQAIYVGIGYEDIETMDSLRFRDYSYPAEIEGYGASVFSRFLRNELIPWIDKKYKTLPKENILIGHSLSGYFVMYNLLQSAIDNNFSFKSYIAGSPFIGNDSLFINLERKMFEVVDSLPIQLFMCSGTIEDTDSMQIVFTDILERRNYKGLKYQSIILNDFEHMDALIPTWSKGLRYMLKYE